jgi:hypothetical protein
VKLEVLTDVTGSTSCNFVDNYQRFGKSPRFPFSGWKSKPSDTDVGTENKGNQALSRQQSRKHRNLCCAFKQSLSKAEKRNKAGSV